MSVLTIPDPEKTNSRDVKISAGYRIFALKGVPEGPVIQQKFCNI
jgi:hypothetical protein